MGDAKINVKLLRHTAEPELTITTAAHMCYANVDLEELQKKMSPERVKKLLNHVLDSGHWSVLEHAAFTFGIEGVSRVLTHQLVRHRIASYSQQSQRYVDETNFAYIVPPKIKSNPEALEKYESFMQQSHELYSELLKTAPKEDARFVLPNAAESRIIVTMNARSLYNFFERRLCTRAQWEIRALANKMLQEVKKVAPLLFESTDAICERLGYCPEKETCGRYPLKKDVVK